MGYKWTPHPASHAPHPKHVKPATPTRTPTPPPRKVKPFPSPRKSTKKHAIGVTARKSKTPKLIGNLLKSTCGVVKVAKPFITVHQSANKRIGGRVLVLIRRIVRGFRRDFTRKKRGSKERWRCVDLKRKRNCNC